MEFSMSELPSTDWGQIRDVLAAAVNFCEQLEALGYSENSRTRSALVNGTNVSVFEVVTSAWTLAEATRYTVIRSRHDANNDLSYVPEAARILAAASSVCAELVHSGGKVDANVAIERLKTWLNTEGVEALKTTLGEP
jgi:hypothetical protein